MTAGFAVLLSWSTSAAVEEMADTIYLNGSILTMAGEEPAYVGALAVKNGTIVFTGSKDQALAMKGDSTKVVDLAGKAMLPGFLDGHSHYINSLLVANQMVKKVYGLKVPLILHCNGDAAIDAFLTAYEFARAGDYSRPWNVTTIHTQFLRKDQIPKFVQYKVRPSFYTLHTFYFAEAHIENRGREQALYISPMRDAIDAGLRPSNHTDFVVAPLDQMMMLWSAVNRVSRAGAQIGPDQRVTVYEGLKAMTDWVAGQYEEEATKGTLEVGKLADLVILDKDPLKVDPMAIKDIKVVETIKGGVTIYPAPAGGEKALVKAPQEGGKTYTWRTHVCDMAGVNQAAHKEWTLTTLNGEKIDVAKPPTMKFAHGKLTIFGGINRLSGSYALVGGSVTMGKLVSTKMAGPPALMELERHFAKTLATVDGFDVIGNELTLSTEGAVAATFRSVE
jgi:hypothetical protein